MDVEGPGDGADGFPGSILNGLLARRLSAAFLERLGPALLGIALVLVCMLGPDILRVPVLVCVLAAYTFATGLVTPSAIAAGLTPLPEVAGAAAAFIGFPQMNVGAVSAAAVGLVLPGTVNGMVGAMGVFGLAALGMVLWMELSRPGRQSKVAQIP